MNDEITNKELKVWLEGEFKAFRTDMDGKFKSVRAEMAGEFKAIKEEIRGVDARLSERINGLDARLEMIQWGMAIFIAPMVIALSLASGKAVYDILNSWAKKH